MTVANVEAQGINTIQWLAAASTTLIVPVYQRQYRWKTDGCEQLLADIRAIATGDARQTHFFGSILYTATNSGELTERMLVDGQQRVTTLTLLLTAIRDTLAVSDEPCPGQIHEALQHPTRREQTRLKLRKEGERELDSIVFGRAVPEVVVEVSHLRDNYDFFCEQIRGDALHVWEGLQKLEHVAITLQEDASPQQVFESLNSTGAPLLNHELIHNYVLMGLNDRQQTEIEDSFWIPIEDNTGDAMDDFLRDYLILRTGRDSEFGGDHGVYEVFKKEFPRPRYESLKALAAEWKSYAEVYRILVDPAQAVDEEVRRQLGYINTFGRAMHPLLLGVYRDYQLDVIGRDALLGLLEQLQSMYLRKMVVGASRDHLAAQLCRKRRQYGYPIKAIAWRTPSDERIREALKHRPLPHAGYVFHRIEEPGDLGTLEIEHIFPQFPRDTWSGDGESLWRDFSEVEHAKYREILSTIGNLALLEQPLNAAASNHSFRDKRKYFECSEISLTRALAGKDVWNLQAVAERTQDLTERFLEIWQRPGVAVTDEPDHLVPILDAAKKPGWYKDWRTEFEYVLYQDEVWEIRDVKSLFQRVFRRLWDTNRTEVLDYSASHNGPVFDKEEWKSQWEPLPGSHYLFMGFVPQYMLGSIQGVLDELDMADDVFVKYSTDDD